MTNIDGNTKKKAELISNNKIYIPENIKLPYPLDRSTAGPGTGELSFAVTFDNKNIKLAVSKDQNEIFSLKKENEYFHISKDDEIFLENIKIIPTLFHAPEQAFINIENRCIYNCAFCDLTDKKHEFFKKYDEQKFVKLILKVSKRPDFKAIALTGGIYPNSKSSTKKMCNIVKSVREKLPNIPIGIETCISEKEEIELLKKAGTDEIKINLQIPDENLFKKICPDFDYHNIFDMLTEAVDIFGKGKVTSNIIYGLGKDDDIVIQTIKKLAMMGVVPTLRKIRINESNKKKIEKALSYPIPKTSASRTIKLALKHKKILEENNLTVKTFETMCHKCGCCDIVPFWDL